MQLLELLVKYSTKPTNLILQIAMNKCIK